MSGPKVVRILSPEEMELLRSRRDQWLLQLRRQIDDWKECLQECKCLSSDKVVQVENIFTRLQSSFFPDFDKSVLSVIEEVNKLKSEMIQTKIDFRTSQAEERRKIERIVRNLIVDFRKTKQQSPFNLDEILTAIRRASDSQLVEIKKSVNAASAILVSSQANKSHEVNESGALSASVLAIELSQGLPEVQKVTDVTSALSNIDMKCARLDRLIIELEILDDPAKLSEFQKRVAVIDELEPGNQKELLIDSVILELSKTCRASAEIQKLRLALSHSLEEVRSCKLETLSQIEKEMEAALESADRAVMQEVLHRSKGLINYETSRKFSEAKRRAILKCFGGLGYDVREGMSTAWAKDGKLILSKKNTPDRGIEIGAAQSLERLQFRAVAVKGPGKERNINSKTVEDEWCSELMLMKEELKAQGHSFEIEQSQPSGIVPLKVCSPTKWMLDDENDESTRSIERKTRLQAKE